MSETVEKAVKASSACAKSAGGWQDICKKTSQTAKPHLFCDQAKQFRWGSMDMFNDRYLFSKYVTLLKFSERLLTKNRSFESHITCEKFSFSTWWRCCPFDLRETCASKLGLDMFTMYVYPHQSGTWCASCLHTSWLKTTFLVWSGVPKWLAHVKNCKTSISLRQEYGFESFSFS